MAKEALLLPIYPSTQYQKGLSPSQLATLNQTIASTLSDVLALPVEKRDTESTRAFLSTFSQDAAFQTLQNLIWADGASETPPKSANEKAIHKRSLLLAEKLSSVDIQTLLDLSIVFARTQPSHLHRVFQAAFRSNPSLAQTISDGLVPGFTSLLSQNTPASEGLYAHRKVAECIFTFLRGAKGIPELIRPFAHSIPCLVALATTYDVGMTATASSYGGAPALLAGISAQNREADEWERLWVETKVTLLDTFHILFTTLLNDLTSSSPGPQLAAEAERTFGIIFGLLEVPRSASDVPSTPFLNQSLLADYQQSYSLSKTLDNALKNAQEKDVRLDLLESTLKSFDDPTAQEGNPKNAGALKILLRSSGIQPGIDNLDTRNHNTHSKSTAEPATNTSSTTNPLPQGKGKSRAASPPPAFLDPDLDLKATQVLDILPDAPVDYVKLLLAHDRYGGNPEQVIEALLEGTAMSQEELERDVEAAADVDYGGDGRDDLAPMQNEQVYSVNERRNVFDDDLQDVSQFRFGKKSAGDEVLRDRTFMEEMKADILRRAEAISDEEDEGEEYTFGESPSAPKINQGKGKEIQGGSRGAAAALGPDDDEDVVALRVAGDGEDSGDDDGDGDDDDDEDGKEEEAGNVQTPETILELAYLRDPKVFERDAATRRSKARADLKAQSGWADEQIEGWRVMLERNPGRKEKLMEKHEFRGNEKGLDIRAGHGSGSRGRGRGGPRGGRGRGGGGGGGRGGGTGGETSARERAWKDKNKASRGNHNRKRGHDKKMARGGAVVA